MAINQSLVLSRWSFAVWLFANDQRPATVLKLFDRHPVIRIDAHLARNLHSFFGDLFGRELGMFRERLRSGLRIRTAAPDCRYSAVGLDHIALTAEQKRLLPVAYEQQRFQVPQKLVGAPVTRQFDGGPPEVPMILLQLSLKPAEERERIRSRSRKAGHNLVVIEPSDLLGGVFDYGLAQSDLAVAGENNLSSAANRQNRRGPNQSFRRHERNFRL